MLKDSGAFLDKAQEWKRKVGNAFSSKEGLDGFSKAQVNSNRALAEALRRQQSGKAIAISPQQKSEALDVVRAQLASLKGRK